MWSRSQLSLLRLVRSWILACFLSWYADESDDSLNLTDLADLSTDGEVHAVWRSYSSPLALYAFSRCLFVIPLHLSLCLFILLPTRTQFVRILPHPSTHPPIQQFCPLSHCLICCTSMLYILLLLRSYPVPPLHLPFLATLLFIHPDSFLITLYPSHILPTDLSPTYPPTTSDLPTLRTFFICTIIFKLDIQK